MRSCWLSLAFSACVVVDVDPATVPPAPDAPAHVEPDHGSAQKDATEPTRCVAAYEEAERAVLAVNEGGPREAALAAVNLAASACVGVDDVRAARSRALADAVGAAPAEKTRGLRAAGYVTPVESQ